MGAGDGLPTVREDAVRRAKEGHSSFEAFTGIPDDPSRRDAPETPWRSVSEGEGIAAFALLACGQQRSVSRSNSRGDPVSSNRVDSGVWGDLLASGGESVNLVLMGGRPKPTDERRDTLLDGTTNSSSGSNDSGMGSYARLKEQQQSMELGPMPSLPPFGGYKPGSGSGSRSRRRSSGSRPSPLRESREPNTLLLALDAPYGSGGGTTASANYGGSSSWGRAYPTVPFAGEADRSDAGGDAVAWRAGPHESHGPTRQRSFDPHMEIDPHNRDIVDLMLPSPSWARSDAAAGTSAHTAVSRADVGVGDKQFAAGTCMPSRVCETAQARGGDRENYHHASYVTRKNDQVPSCAERPRQVGTKATSAAPRVDHQPQAPAWVPPTPAVDQVDHSRKPSYDLLATMIPSLTKLGSALGSRVGVTSRQGDGTLQGLERSPTAVVDVTEAAAGIHGTAVLPVKSELLVPPLTRTVSPDAATMATLNIAHPSGAIDEKAIHKQVQSRI